jgi:DtxR family Mn-dependent transcriptional regulator
MVHPEFLEQPLEELLELIWLRRERGDRTVAGLLARSREPGTETVLRQLEDRSLIAILDGEVRFTEPGEARARTVVRRHRLAERLLSDVLDVPLAESEQQACLMEHILSPVVTERVCGFLGHPPTCPHGSPIPPGECCTRKRGTALEPVVTPLGSLPPGVEARIVFIAPGVLKRLDRLGSFGVVPGTMIVLRQKHPSFVIEVGGTSLALEGDIAREIYVRRES